MFIGLFLLNDKLSNTLNDKQKQAPQYFFKIAAFTLFNYAEIATFEQSKKGFGNFNEG